VSSLSRILGLVLNILEYCLYCLILIVFKARNLSHNVLKQILYQKLGISVRLQPLIYFNFDHFTDFVSYLNLLIFKTIYFIPDCITNFTNFCSQTNLLTSSGKFFLFDPPIYTSQLRFEIVLQLCNHLVFSLKFCSYYCVHLVITISKFVRLMATLFLIHFFFDLNLVFNIVDCSCTFILFSQKSVHKISKFYLQSCAKLSIHLIKHSSKLFAIFKSIYFNASKIFFFFILVSLQKLYGLFKTHQLNFHFFKNFVQEACSCITFSIYDLTRLFSHSESLLKCNNSFIDLATDTSQHLLVFFGLCWKSDNLLHQYSIFFFGFSLGKVIFWDFWLQNRPHLTQFLLALGLKTLNEIWQLITLFLTLPKLLLKLVSNPFLSFQLRL